MNNLRKTVFLFLFLSFGLTVLLGGCTHSRANGKKDTSSSTPLSVMTYNIKVGVGGGPKHLPATEGLEKVAKLIEQHQPDVLLVQEIEKNAKRSMNIDEISWLGSRLNYPYRAFAPAIIEGEWNYGVAIFSRYPMKNDFQRFLLYKPDYSKTHSEYPDYYSEQRVLLQFDIEVKGIPLSLFSTHLGLTPDQREQQVLGIRKHLMKNPNLKILGGDFNADPQSKELKPLKEILMDVLDEINVSPKDRLSYPAGTTSKKAIDTIFVSPQIQIQSARVIRDETLASDHNPVIAELRILNRP